jgi:predicted Zn finger-like uncharacterized protein
MHITCPSCASEYDLPEGSVGPGGRKVRCVECQTIWQVNALAGSETGPTMSAAPEPTTPYESRSATAQPEEMAEPDQAQDNDSADLNAWMTMANGKQADEGTGNDQNGIDSLFDDVPSEDKAETLPVVIEANNDAAAEIQAPLTARPATRAKRGLIHGHVGQFRTSKNRVAPLAVGAAALLLALIMGAVAFRSSIVAALPQMAGLYKAFGITVNLRGLEIIDIASELTEADGISVLVIKGTVRNPGHEARDVPPLFLAVLDENEKEHYGWSVTLEERRIEAGASLPFRRRLATPPAEARKVMVRFYKQGDPKPAGPAADAPAKDAAATP